MRESVIWSDHELAVELRREVLLLMTHRANQAKDYEFGWVLRFLYQIQPRPTSHTQPNPIPIIGTRDEMPNQQQPKLRLHHGSSAMAISQSVTNSTIPNVLKYDPVTIRAPPKTDLWRKPPSTDIDNVPIYLISQPIDLHKFHTARVTVSGNWSTLYDQGGLALFIPDEDLKKWVKTGIEFVWGKPFVGTVATSRWSDWSLVPLPESANGKVTIQVERETKGTERVESLWIYIINEDTGEKMGIREITWWFRQDVSGGDTEAPEEPRSLLIGLYAARPTVPEGAGREKEELEVKLEGFEVTLFDD